MRRVNSTIEKPQSTNIRISPEWMSVAFPLLPDPSDAKRSMTVRKKRAG
jgi:hypothetical protein